MARKYGKNETTLSNVLKLVKALLALADEEIAVPGDKLKATFYVEWVKEDELLVSGKVQQKRNNITKTVEKGITKEDLWTLVEWLGEALELSQPKDEKKVDNAQRRSDAIQDILDCLKDLEILAEELIDGKPAVKTQGFWKFSLKLKHQTKPKEENLKVIKEKWKIKIGTVTVETTRETTFISKDQPLNWQEICRQNLALQKKFTTKEFQRHGAELQLDEIYVPLAIVERKPPKPPSRNQQEEKEEKEEEKLIPIAEESFFEDVLRQGKSDISQGRKIAIIGEPGSGKTTRLQKITDWILEQDLGLPIWISLADLTQPTITKYIEEIWLKQTGKSLTIDELTQQKERIWLLLDGLDEMTSKVEMRHVSALLGGWVQAARVVVTCRVNVWEADKNAFSGFDVFRNLEFNPEQVTDYIHRWFAGIGDAATGESLEAALAQSENSRLKELIQNPLRLWMLCQIWQPEGSLPETQAGLYAKFVDWVYRWKADEKILKQREAIDKALARLALAAMEQKDEVSRLRLRESWVVKVLGSRPIFQAVMKLGWLNRVERLPEAICVFYHATFQEYFAALAVDDWDYFLPRNHVNFPVVGKEYRIFEAQWKQVILLWLGRGDVVDEEKEGFIEKLVNFEDGCGEWNFEKVDRGFYEYRAYFLVAAGISEFKTCTLADVIVDQVVQWGFGYLNIETQKRINFVDLIQGYAEQILPKMDYQRVVTKLIRILDNTDDKDIHWNVALILGKIDLGNEKAISYFITILKGNANPYTKDSAVEILGEIGGGNAKAIDALISFMEISRSGFTQLGVVKALEKLDPNNKKILDILNELLFCNNEKVILQAAEKLLRLNPGETRIIKTLIQLLQTSINRPVPQLGKGFYLYDATPQKVISTFKRIAIKNKEIITSLISMLETTQDENIRRVISEVTCILKSIENEDTFSNLVDISAETSFRNKEAEREIGTLISVLASSEDSYTCKSIAESLSLKLRFQKFFIAKDNYLFTVSALKKHLTNEVYKNDFDLYHNCFTILWIVAQNLPYPDFYRAWHGLTETQTSPLIQTLNLAQLPQLLQTQLTETNLHQTLQLLCIDSSKFDNPDNPAADIYLQLVKKHHCPKSTEGTPRTLTELKIYWQLLDWEKHPILIFYEEAKPQGFSQTFLDSLTRFDATICVITDSPHPTIPTFSPQDANLIQTIMTWLQRNILEI